MAGASAKKFVDYVLVLNLAPWGSLDHQKKVSNSSPSAICAIRLFARVAIARL